MSRRPIGDEHDNETFLSRWSRRKLSTADTHNDQEAVVDEAPEREDDSRPETAAGAENSVRVLSDEDMPDLDSLGDDSDYAGFMSSGVSAELRRVALRKMFHAATYNVCDGLDDYAEDYTTFEKLGDIVTADMRHRMEVEAEKLRETQLAELEADPGGAADESTAVAMEEPGDGPMEGDADSGDEDSTQGET